ncbi:hypothetical protein OIU34_16855 [Pararhizobium sp. BT-229]|uniref:hypothetical protein n=1 Tax=Pararhizobium sp. BT-229 TaxID=2986923 RepID=UPI0021F7365B|nr:hypothetical protein [Pararhizobium sp. BT-229]MCV9963575.1 hypothetical protein [Pararhizobium sp. BT-229]
MSKATHVTAKVPLLVLAQGVPPGSRFKKMCLSMVECEISFKVVPSSETTVAFTIPKSTEGSNGGYYERYGEAPYGRQNIVCHEDALYHDVVLDAKDLVERMKEDVYFRPGRSSVFKEELLTAVTSCTPRMVWPDDLHAHAKNSRFLYLDLTKLKTLLKDADAVKYTDEGLQQIEDAKRRFREGLSDVLVIDGRVHMGCGEPLYLYKPNERMVDVRAWDSAFWRGSSRPGSYVDAKARFFPANREDDLRQAIGRPAPTIGTIGIVDEAEIRFPLEEMEYYRMACALVTNAEIWLGKREVISKVDRHTLDAYADLRDLVKSVDPLVDGVPPSIEEKFEALVACIPRIPKVPHEVYVAEEDIEYARGMWDNRPILTSLSAPARRMA